MQVTAVIRPSRDMRPPSWFRLQHRTHRTVRDERHPALWPVVTSPALNLFRDETLLHQPRVAEQGRAPMRGNRYISPALTERTRERHARIWPNCSNLLEAPEAPSGRPLHLSRFSSKSLFYMNHRKGRGGHLEHPEALHLSRQSVARLTPGRCISPARVLHLSVEMPFSTI